MAVKFGNNAATLLAANASSSATVLTVSDGSVFPTLSGADYTYVTLEDVNSNREIVKVTAISGNELTVVRAQDGSSARAFSTSDKCELRITAALLNAVSTETVNGTSARFKFTATANQTTFSGSDDNSVTLEYNVGYIDLYLSGIRLIAGSDYTASNGTSIVLAAGASVNDIIEIVSYGTFVLADIAINDMTDVNTTGIADGSILAYDNTDARFEKSTILSQSSSGVAVVGNITVTGTVDGRDVATDGTKLDGIEASADVTDTANVTAAGALMDSELTSIASVKALNQGVATTDSPTFAAVTANGGVVVDNFTLDGTTLALSSGDLTLDSASSINLNADNGNIVFQDGAVTTAMFQQTSSNFIIRSLVSDKDIIFQGEDGATSIIALTLDMSNAGAATFNSKVGIGIAPTHPLQVSAADGTLASFTNASDADFNFKTASGVALITPSTGTLALGTSNTERMRIDSSGRVGIANSAPSVELALGSGGGEKLHVYHGGSVKAGFGVDLSGSSRELSMFHSTSGTNGNISFGKRLESNGAYTEAMRIDSSGAVGFKKTPPSGSHTSWSQLFIGEKGTLISESANSGGLFGTWLTDNMYIKQSTGAFGNVTTDQSSAYKQEAGIHHWYSQASGSANAAITLQEQMRLDSSGNLTGTMINATNGEYDGSLDDLKKTGFYRSKNSNTNNPSYAYYSVVVYGNQGNVTAQIATLLSGPATYVRSFNTSWTSWVRIDD